MKLLVGDELRNTLVASFSKARKVTILTAYFTLPAAKLLLDNLPTFSQGRVIVRARPSDLLSSATDIRAIRHLHDNGVPCHIHRSLHAKLYIIDNQSGWVGSSNFTSNGLKISGYGNVELSTEIVITENELNLVRTIINDSIFVSNDILKRLESFVATSDIESVDTIDDWWENVLDIAPFELSDGLLIADLPWCNPCKENSSEAEAHDVDLFGYGVSGKIKRSLECSKVYQFLLKKIEQENNKEAYFGQITEWIHSALKDDTLPYRSEVKDYVANLYSYIEMYGQEHFIVDRPNYSQRIKLVNHD